MNDVTRILSAIEQGDPQAAAQLLPLVYDELRQLAAHKLAQEKPGQTLQATALVHEAYLRLVGSVCRFLASTGHRLSPALTGPHSPIAFSQRNESLPSCFGGVNGPSAFPPARRVGGAFRAAPRAFLPILASG
jgi:hypothetical protein